MALLARIFVVTLAFLVACVAAAAVMMLGFLSPEASDLVDVAAEHGSFWVVVGVFALLVAAYAMIPSMILIALAESFRWRSVVLYGLIGGAVALLCYHGFGPALRATPGDALLTRESEVIAAAGIAAGLVYWLLAGRKAGCWRELRAQTRTPAH